ncbi:hypothetical protein LXL04_022793 [Taraxacum kok-saghyz]
MEVLQQQGFLLNSKLKSPVVSPVPGRRDFPNKCRKQQRRGSLIKAWFRELPCGVLDGLSPEEVLECNTEEECCEVVKQLKTAETALMNWVVDLMADVVEQEEFNKINARNIAMVFAPNMTQPSSEGLRFGVLKVLSIV